MPEVSPYVTQLGFEMQVALAWGIMSGGGAGEVPPYVMTSWLLDEMRDPLVVTMAVLVDEMSPLQVPVVTTFIRCGIY